MLVRVSYVLVCWLSVFVVPTWANDLWVEVGSATARVSEATMTMFPESDASYSQLRFQIAHGDVFVNQARIYLVNGAVFNTNLQTNLRGSDYSYERGLLPRTHSRAIPLVSSQQIPIKKVKVFYNFKYQQSPSQPVTLTLFGIPAGSPTPEKSAGS